MKKVLRYILSLAAMLTLMMSITPFTTAAAEETDDDIVEIALSNDDFSILVSALQKAELVEALQGEGPFTVFAPTNAAFEKLLGELDITAEELLAQPDLAKVLTYHVVSGKVLAADLSDGMTAATLNEEELTFDLTGTPMVNDSNITTTDIEASNGVIHVIDTILVPSNFTLQEVDLETEAVADTGIEGNSLLLVSILITGAMLLLVVFKKKAV
ncbi:fasciclin domain-containing protein [Jeotgalibaca sp. A127]|uniref:fasciclin domain-containing protein n=1 Tax=Jeotgalibaca sp. A127 TaxID=3457324 RepID=UPI003FD50515